jgi:hypothetical protein
MRLSGSIQSSGISLRTSASSREQTTPYGDAKLYPKIFDANKDKLTDPDKIQVGQVLKLP